MKSDKIIDAMNDIEDKYIMEAHEPVYKKSKLKTYWKPVAGFAVCACAALVILPRVFFNGDYAAGSSMKKEAYADNYIAQEPGAAYQAKNEASEEMYEMDEAGENGNTDTVLPSKQIVNAYLELETKDLDSVTKNIQEATQENKGYIQSSNLYKSYANQRVYSATVRVPAEVYDDFSQKMKELGNVISYSESVEDITDLYYDVEGHIDSLKAERERVKEFYEKATTVEELTSVEKRLSEIEYELNSYQAQKKNYDTLTNYSTLTITATETKEYTETEDDFFTRLSNAFSLGWSHFVDGIMECILLCVYNIWTILLLVVLGFVGYKGYKHIRNK
ncbi:MAG: DUF4349 domain-containing protein [Firmicutes bacterium]|nr:DUF4349 domain-containing protein [Bacillota bacterium]